MMILRGYPYKPYTLNPKPYTLTLKNPAVL